MNTCDTCKWWEPPEPHLRGGENPSMYTTSYGVCNNPSVNDPDEVVKVGKATKELSHASPESSDNHCLCFGTGPKFGCIHHLVK